MSDYIKLYSAAGQVDGAFLLDEGSVFFYASNDDKYSINGRNLVVGTTEILMKHFMGVDTPRIETAITGKTSKLKKIQIENFISGMKNFSFIFNVSMVLARQVLLTNQIINKNMEHLIADEKKTRDYSIEYYKIINRLEEEYNKRKLPWIKDILKKSETSLTYKKGEAFYKSSEPTKIQSVTSLTENDVEYSRDSIICEQGSFGEEMYILKTGSLDVIVNGNKVATIEEPGTFIGEMALLLGEKRTATLKAKNNVIITTIKKQNLREIAEKQIDILIGVATSLAKRHYYNILKIENINKSIIEQSLTAEQTGEPKPMLAERALVDLRRLKNEVEKSIKDKKVDFLNDIMKGL